MSHVANIDLCRELYELSGWEDTESWLSASDLLPEVIDGKKTGRYKRQQVPAYDLGFLLRKLPAVIDEAPLTLCTDGTGVLEEIYWCAYYFSAPVIYKTGYDDKTPEDAACKLAIELFKQGVLKL